MTGPELKALAEQLHVNPYYLGYALATGARNIDEAFKRDGGNHHFMIWNNARWSEQAKAEGISREFVSIEPGAVDRHIAICARHIAEQHALANLDNEPWDARRDCPWKCHPRDPNCKCDELES